MNRPTKRHRFFIAFFLLSTSFLLPASKSVHAQTADDLQSKIDSRNSDIQALEKEIAGYQSQIDSLNGQASSLSGTIASLNLTQKKLAADIAVTQDKIDATTIQIQQLAKQIDTTQGTISDDALYADAAFRSMYESGSRSTVVTFLASQSISAGLDAVNSLALVQSGLQKRIISLNAAKTGLETNKAATETARTKLADLQKQQRDQRSIVLSTQAQQKALLAETKDSEASYQQLLAVKRTQEAAFEQEITALESQLNLTVNASSLPPTGSAPLSWPLDQIAITQYFGNTPFATANAQIYNNHGHDGVDFRASIGTPIKAALSGTVIGESNTDAIRGCYSFGKWIMLKHADGLSTLYAHLSLQSVAVGQSVSTGDIIGYSGNTGYTTGPHLHFGVYATQGTEIKLFSQSVHCQGATIPIAVLSAYLNPLSYLPPLKP